MSRIPHYTVSLKCLTSFQVLNHQKRQANVEPASWLKQSGKRGPPAGEDVDMTDSYTSTAPPSNVWSVPRIPAAHVGRHVGQASHSTDVDMLRALLDTEVGLACNVPAMLPRCASGSATPAGQLEQMGNLGDSQWAKPDVSGHSECRATASALKPAANPAKSVSVSAFAENVKPGGFRTGGSFLPTAQTFTPSGPISIYGAEPAKIVSVLTGKKPALLKDSRWA